MSQDKETAAPIAQWLAMPMDAPTKQAMDRIRRAEDVVHIAVMPDVHVAGDVCVGTAMATHRLIYPSAVGGDIGCGMFAIAFNSSADILREARHAGTLLKALGERIPTQRRNRAKALPYPASLSPTDLSHPQLQSLAAGDAHLQLGTLGGGNHFVELQFDETNQLWLMIHSGSRSIGQEIKSHHVARSTIRSASLPALDSDTARGQAYLHDQNWARQFADANRRTMAEQVVGILHSQFKVDAIDSSIVTCDHNHVRREDHFNQSLFVHRKGAMPAAMEQPGVIPGSMGTLSFHIQGRGCPDSLLSSAHGAGRLLSRRAAHTRFSRAELREQMQGVWFDPHQAEALREESPKSYKDIRSVMRAQRNLVKIVRTLRPLLVYKGQ